MIEKYDKERSMIDIGDGVLLGCEPLLPSAALMAISSGKKQVSGAKTNKVKTSREPGYFKYHQFNVSMPAENQLRISVKSGARLACPVPTMSREAGLAVQSCCFQVVNTQNSDNDLYPS